MDSHLNLPVQYKGEDLEFPFSVVPQGYQTRYVVLVDEIEVVMERDEGGGLRAIIYNQDQLKGKLPEPGLIEAITSVIEQLTS